MNVPRRWSLALMALALVLLLTPWIIFPVCGVGRYAPPLGAISHMPACWNTLMAETIVGVLFFLAGLWAWFVPRRPVVLATAMLAALFGFLVMLFPAVITGVCMMATMPCVYGTRPALLVIGFLMVLLGMIGIVIFRKIQ